jgi:hypothetical protein
MAHSTRRHPRGMSTANDRCGAHRRSEGCEKALPPRVFLGSLAEVLTLGSDVRFGSGNGLVRRAPSLSFRFRPLICFQQPRMLKMPTSGMIFGSGAPVTKARSIVPSCTPLSIAERDAVEKPQRTHDLVQRRP